MNKEKEKTRVVLLKNGKRIVVDADFTEHDVPDWYKDLVEEDEADATK